jgi:hypothetical protein
MVVSDVLDSTRLIFTPFASRVQVEEAVSWVSSSGKVEMKVEASGRDA